MNATSRRKFCSDLLGTITTWSLLDVLSRGALLAGPVGAVVDRWVRDLHAVCRDLKREGIPQTAWQDRVEELTARVPLQDLLAAIDFERLRRDFTFPEDRANTRAAPLPRPDGIPDELAFHSKIFGLRRDTAIVPHGHENMASMHVVLKGAFALRHFHKVEQREEAILARPTIDRVGRPGDASTISDERDNIHWFRALEDGSFTLDVIVLDLDPERGFPYRMLFVDPDRAEAAGDGLLRLPRIGAREAIDRYGRLHHHEPAPPA